MKKMIALFSGSSLIAAGAFTIMSMAYSTGGKIKVYLQNSCASEVTIKIEDAGGTINYGVPASTTKPDAFMDGTKIWDKNGQLLYTVAPGSEGKTIVVCE